MRLVLQRLAQTDDDVIVPTIASVATVPALVTRAAAFIAIPAITTLRSLAAISSVVSITAIGSVMLVPATGIVDHYNTSVGNTVTGDCRSGTSKTGRHDRQDNGD